MQLIKSLLNKSNVLFIIIAISAAFITYTSMYGIRQPFKAGTYNSLELWGISYKVLMVTSQVLGYMLSKFAGIRIISEMKQKGRFKGILLCNAIALLALLFFGITPYPYNFFWMFLNGLPLGLVFGLVFSYLEGRRTTEILSIGLGSSIIISSGYAKTIGKWIIQTYGISEWWMPFITGCIFFIPLIFGCLMLESLPPPNQQDITHRTERVPMAKADRKTFFIRFAPGIILIVCTYILLTILRDFRDTFMVEIWQELGFQNPSLMTSTEIPITIMVLLLIGLITYIPNNQKAFIAIQILIIAGILFSGIITFLFKAQFINPVIWMILTGLGLFIGYILFNTIFFERMIASIQVKSNIGYLMYLADSFGYLGSVIIMVYKDFGNKTMHYKTFFSNAVIIASFIITMMMLFSLGYFTKKINQ